MSAFFFFEKRGLPAISNMQQECFECISWSEERNSSVKKCRLTKQKRRKRGLNSEEHGYKFYFCDGEDIKSTRIFNRKFDAQLVAASNASDALRDVSEGLRSQSSLYMHNVVKLNAQSIQSIHAAFPNGAFERKSRDELFLGLSDYIRENPESTAKLVVDLLKNETLEKAELSLHDKLSGQDELNLLEYEVHKIVLLVLNTFWDDFRDKNVYVDIGSFYGRASLDFDCLTMVLVHMLDNSKKYTLPSSTLDIDFRQDENKVSLIFTMLSLKILKGELSRLFDQGFSGNEPKRLNKDGNGLGLWVVRELLSGMGGEITVEANIDPSKNVSKLGIDYEVNRFTIQIG